SVLAGAIPAGGSAGVIVPANTNSGNSNSFYKIVATTPVEVQIGSGQISDVPWGNSDWFPDLSTFEPLGKAFRFATAKQASFGDGIWVTAIAPTSGTSITLTSPVANIRGNGSQDLVASP